MSKIKVVKSQYGKTSFDWVAHTDKYETDENLIKFYADERNEMGNLLSIETVETETDDVEATISGMTISTMAAYRVAQDEIGIIRIDSLDAISAIFENEFGLWGDLVENAHEDLSDFGADGFCDRFGFDKR